MRHYPLAKTDFEFFSPDEMVWASESGNPSFGGGLPVSLYNAMTEEGVDALVAFMHDFEQKQG